MGRSIKRLSLNKLYKVPDLPIPIDDTFSYHREVLYKMGMKLITDFCDLNNVKCPNVTLYNDGWPFSEVCAFYRPDTQDIKQWNRPSFPPGICIYLPKCAFPCTNLTVRQWSWPASDIDKTPYGVLAHELGHHFDYESGKIKGTFYSEYSIEVYKESKERRITNYGTSPAEWFAEMFRVYVTNPNLLLNLKPKTYVIINRRWKHLPKRYWRDELGKNVPDKIVNNLIKKGARLR